MKHLYDSLRGCAKEEEVKAEFCKFFSNTMRTDNDASAGPDDDGLADGAEVAQASDPADPSDCGQAGNRVPVPFYFGDHSGSHSEKYLLEVEPVAAIGMGVAPHTFAWVNANYGACETRTAMLKPGWKYEVRLRHAGTNPAYAGTPNPDYDYTLQPVTNALPPYVQVSDPDSLFGEDDTSTTFSAKDKAATISVYKFTVEEIKFNHDTTSCSSDAVSIRRNAREGFDTSHGEWWSGVAVLKNDPVCYAGNVRPTVKAKIRVSPHLNSARLSAQAVETSSPLKGLTESTVIFSDGMSDWTDFSTDSTIVRTVRKFDHRWEWKVSQMNGAVVSEFACATTGPHRVYTLLADPKAPWMPNGTSTKNLWTNALEFCNAFLEGKDEPLETMATITSNLFHHMGFRYDTVASASHYLRTDGTFELTRYMASEDNLVNCYDQAYGVATLAGLVGMRVRVVEAMPFGYINTTNLVGVGMCNNPAYEMTEKLEYWKDEMDDQGHLFAKTETNTVLRAAICSEDETQRSFFLAHVFVGMGDGQIFDACVGPALGTTHINDYMRSLIDYSTENERRVSRYLDGVTLLDTMPNHDYKLK